LFVDVKNRFFYRSAVLKPWLKALALLAVVGTLPFIFWACNDIGGGCADEHLYIADTLIIQVIDSVGNDTLVVPDSAWVVFSIQSNQYTQIGMRTIDDLLDFRFSTAFATSPCIPEPYFILDSIFVTSNQLFDSLAPAESLNELFVKTSNKKRYDYNWGVDLYTLTNERVIHYNAEQSLDIGTQNTEYRFGTHTFTIRCKRLNGTWQELITSPVRFE
jgi:hypothetical protein